MSETKYGVVAVGNALVDVLSQVSEDFITDQQSKAGMEKGAMTQKSLRTTGLDI